MIPLVADIHTHNPSAIDAVINLEPDMAMRADALYSVGIHPWWRDIDFAWVERMAADERVVMIGECGIDTLRGVGGIDRQMALLERHALLAEQTKRPLLLHIVGAWAEAIALKRRFMPRQPWIIHGFRGKPELAQQLLREDFYISLGKKFNPETEKIIPNDKLLRESDAQPTTTTL